MKKYTYIIAFLYSILTYAQITVKDNSYIFNKGTIVYSRGNLNLQGTNSNFYLRNEGQFIQGTTAASTNTGVGSLSVFQEGTVNNFGYNYWCSPIGNASVAVGNENFGVGMLKIPTTSTNSNPATLSSAVLNGLSSNGALTIATYWIYKFLASDNYSQWISVGSSSTIAAGEGFTMKGASGTDSVNPGETVANNPGNAQRYDFRGKPNDGTIDITVTGPTIGTQYPNSTLTGNPYPSAINLNYFLLENSGYSVNYLTGVVSTGGPVDVINGNAYFWEQLKPATSHVLTQYIGGYGVYSPNNTNANSPGTYAAPTWKTYNPDGSINTTGAGSGSTYKRMFSPVGQGFMVQGKGVGTFTAQMKNVYRTFVKEGIANNSQFERNSNTLVSNDWDEIPNVAGVDYTQFSRNEVPQIKIQTILNNEFTKETILAFNPFTSDGYDNAMDAVSADDNLTNDVYFSLTGSEKSFVITTLPFDINKRIPFTLKAGSQATFKTTVSDIINFNEAENIYLYDNVSGIYHDIKNTSFELNLPAGIYQNRFEITFLNQALSVNDNSVKDNLLVLQNNSNQLLTILNSSLLEIESIQLFDITGKQIFNKKGLNINPKYDFSTASLSDGVYLVKIYTKDSLSKSHKIIVSNK